MPTGSSSPVVSPPAHILLDPRFNNVKVLAKVVGGTFDYQEATVWGTLVEGQQRIVLSVNKALKEVNHSWIELKHPNVMRTDSLLVVITGEHTSTFVRRLHHKKEGDEYLAVCQVVVPREGLIDEVLDTTLVLRAEDLACVVETPQAKKLNVRILKSERDKHRRSHT